MSVLKMFALHDAKAGFFNVPFFMPSIGQAVRAVTDLCADPGTIVSRHPGDFSLYELGRWDDATGTFEPNVPPTYLASAESLSPVVRSSRGGASFSEAVDPLATDGDLPGEPAFRSNGGGPL